MSETELLHRRRWAAGLTIIVVVMFIVSVTLVGHRLNRESAENREAITEIVDRLDRENPSIASVRLRSEGSKCWIMMTFTDGHTASVPVEPRTTCPPD